MLVDHYVKDEEGTGVVHQAPYFGAVSSIILQMCLWEVNGSGHFAWDAESPVSLSVSQLPRPVESAFFFFGSLPREIAWKTWHLQSPFLLLVFGSRSNLELL